MSTLELHVSVDAVDAPELTGSFSLEPIGQNHTRVQARLEYDPDTVQDTFRRAQGVRPDERAVERLVRGDLEHFKEYVEQRQRQEDGERGDVRQAAGRSPRSGSDHGIAVGADHGCVFRRVPRCSGVLRGLPACGLHGEGVLAAQGPRSGGGARPWGGGRRVHPAHAPFRTTRRSFGGARSHRLVEFVDDDLAHVSTVGCHEVESSMPRRKEL